MGAIARFINSVPTFGFLVFFPTVFADDIGFGEHRWLLLVSVTFGSCIFFNLMSGILSDKLGWRNTVFWLGCVGCTISMLTLYFIPAAVGADHYWVALLCGIFFGLTLSGWVPLSALVPSLAPENKGGAMALLNLGAGASAFVGPALVGLLLGPIGPGGLVIVFSGLYAVAAALVWFCRLPEDHAHLSAHAADEVPEPVVAVTTPV
jgi:MFS family permease